MAGSHGKTATSGEHHGVGHVVSFRILFLVWATLVVLTWVTVAATYYDFGSMNIMIALGIAVVKSALVVLFFMHLRWDNPFNAIVFISSILFLMLFISFALIDTKEYAPQIIPGYAPRIEAAAKEREAGAAAPAAPSAAPTTSTAPGDAAAPAPTSAAPQATDPSATPPADAAAAPAATETPAPTATGH